MSARDRLARLLRLDPDHRVEAMRLEVAALRARVDRLRVALAEASRLARTVAAARDEARAGQEAADRVAGLHARKLRRIADVLADQSLDAADACDRARQVLMEDGPVSGGGVQ